MALFHAPAARLPAGWATDVRFDIAEDGTFVSIAANAPPAGAQPLGGPVIPGMPNLHSHAFQRAMAGLAEWRSAKGDDFWSWRETMYLFLARLTPDDVEAIATQLYIEMVKAGYTRVCEFHYLHNDVNGKPYSDPAIMARAHLKAADAAGIGITMVPTLYTSGGCGGKPLKPTQTRFANSPDGLAETIRALAGARGNNASVAVGVHSLRAVRMDEVESLLSAFPEHAFHIHVSEQRGELEECRAWSGRTPIAQLAHTVGLGPRWNLVHATHITTEEIEAVVAAGANVALCPTTEGNLGDGLFPAGQYLKLGGMFGIGTDSHVTIDPREELRWFEYGRRLNAERRALSANESNPHVGAWLWLNAAQGGRAACEAPVGRLEAGARADFLVLDDKTPGLSGRSGDTLLDAFVFAAMPDRPIAQVWVGGTNVVKGGHHAYEDEAAKNYRATIARLRQA